MLQIQRTLKLLLIAVVLSSTSALAQTSTTSEDIHICTSTTELQINLIELTNTGNWSVKSGAAQFKNSNSNQTRAYSIGLGKNVLIWKEYNTNKNLVNEQELIVYNDTIIADVKEYSITGDDILAYLEANTRKEEVGLWSFSSGSGNFYYPRRSITPVFVSTPGYTVARWTVTEGYCTGYDEVLIRIPVNAGTDQYVCENSANL